MSLVHCLLAVVEVLSVKLRGSRNSPVMEQCEYHQILGGFIATPVEDIFKEYKTETKLTWFHLMCSVNDFIFILSCKEFKFYTLCRCHQVANDKSTAHEHF